MRLISWNIYSFSKDSLSKVKAINRLIYNVNSIAVLQEVTPDIFEELSTSFGSKFHVIYSLDYRKPSTFDGKERFLGIAMIISKNYEIIRANVLRRTLFPDRTLMVVLKDRQKTIKVIGLHSITGSDYKKAKSVQFATFAESINKHKPDFVMIDANEPEVDHPDVNKIQYWNNNGKGTLKFFSTLTSIGIIDSVRLLPILNQHQSIPLATSYIDKKSNIKRRYDHIYVKSESHKIKKVRYLYDEGVEAGSDHAIVLCDI